MKARFRPGQNGEEVAYVALDFLPTEPPDQLFLVLYEIFVPRAVRRKGIGTRILEVVELVARQKGI